MRSNVLLIVGLVLVLSACGILTGNFDSRPPAFGRISGQMTILDPLPERGYNYVILELSLKLTETGETLGSDSFGFWATEYNTGENPVLEFSFPELPVGSYELVLYHRIFRGDLRQDGSEITQHVTYRDYSQIQEADKAASLSPPIFYDFIVDYVLSGLVLEKASSQLDDVKFSVNLTGMPHFGDVVVEDIHEGSFPPEAVAQVTFYSNGWQFFIDTPFERGSFGHVSAILENISLQSPWNHRISVESSKNFDYGPWGNANAKISGTLSARGYWDRGATYLFSAAFPGSTLGSGIVDVLKLPWISHFESIWWQIPESVYQLNDTALPFHLKWLKPGDYVLRLFWKPFEGADYQLLFESSEPITLRDGDHFEGVFHEVVLP